MGYRVITSVLIPQFFCFLCSLKVSFFLNRVDSYIFDIMVKLTLKLCLSIGKIIAVGLISLE